MEAKESPETYIALYCARIAGFDGWDFHSFHVDEADANHEINRAEADMPIRHSANVMWRMEVRNAKALRDLMAALDARRPAWLY